MTRARPRRPIRSPSQVTSSSPAAPPPTTTTRCSASASGLLGNGSFIGNPQDYYNLRNERAVSGFDLTQRFVQTIIYDVPFFRSLHGGAKYLLDGFQVATIVTAQSGVPNDVEAGKTVSGYPAIENKQWLRAVAVFNRLPEIAKALRSQARSKESPDKD